MKKRLFLILCLFSSFHFFLTAQTNACSGSTPQWSDNPCRAPFFCSTANLNNYCNQMGPPGRNFAPTKLCPGLQIDNNHWFKFIAGTPTLTLQFEAYGCTDGVQAQIFFLPYGANCSDSSAYKSASTCINRQGFLTNTLTANNLMTDSVYYLMVDGYSGDQCNYQISLPIPSDSIKPAKLSAPTSVAGPISICGSGKVGFRVKPVPGAVSYTWDSKKVGPTVSIATTNPTLDSINFTFPNTPDVYPLTVLAVDACGNKSPPYLFNVTVGALTSTNPTPFKLCEGQPAITYADTSLIYYTGAPASKTVSYNWTAAKTGKGCDSIVQLTLQYYPKTTTTQTLFARPGENIIVCGQTYNVTAGQCNPVSAKKICAGSANGCDSTVNLTIYNTEISPATVAPANPALTCTSNSVQLTVTPPAGKCPALRHNFSYKWFLQSAPANILSKTTSLTATNAGVYQVVVQDSVGLAPPQTAFKIYQDTLNVTVTGSGATPGQPGVIAGPANPCQGDTVVYSVAPVPGAATYFWYFPLGTNVVTSQSFDTIKVAIGASGGQISVTANNGCGSSPAATKNFNVSVRPVTPGAITGVAKPCERSVEPYSVLPVAGATSYAWTVPAGATLTQGQGTASVKVNWGNSTGGVLTVSAVGACGASAPDTQLIIVNTFANLNAGRDSAVCGLNYTLKATTSTGSGIWSFYPNIPAAQFASSINPSTTVTAAQPGIYHFVWTETQNGCTKSDTVNITFYDTPAVPTPSDSCSPNKSQLFVNFNVAGGSSPYTIYYANTANIAGTVVNGVFHSSTLVPGSYSFVIKDSKGCASPPASVNDFCNSCTTKAGSMDVTPISACEKDSVIAIYNGGQNLGAGDVQEFALHTGDPRGGIIFRSKTPAFIYGPPLAFETIYFISAIAGLDSSGHVQLSSACFNASQNVQVVFHKSPTAALSGDTTICGNGCVPLKFKLTGRSPFSVVYNNGLADTTLTKASDGLTQLVCPQASTTYKLISIRDSNNCSANLTGKTNVTIAPAARGGTPLPDLSICTKQDTTVQLSGRLNGFQPGGSWIETSAVPSTGGAFDPSKGVFRTLNQKAANYTFKYLYTGNASCGADTETVAIQLLFTPVADAGPAQTLTCAILNSVKGGVTLGGPNTTTGTGISIFWPNLGNGIRNNATPITSDTGKFYLVVSEGQCFAVDSVVIKADTASPVAKIKPVKTPLTCTLDTITLDGTASAPAGKISYQWSLGIRPFDSNPTTQVTVAGTYHLLVTNNNNGCFEMDTVTIVANQAKPKAAILPPSSFNCRDTTVQLDAGQSSVGKNYSFVWKTTGRGHFKSGITTLTPVVDSVAKYTLVVSDSTNGCVDSAIVDVQQDVTQVFAKTKANDTLKCSNKTITLSGSGSSIGYLYTYQWFTRNGHLVKDSTTLNPTVDQPGEYYLIVGNKNNNCGAIDSVFVKLDTAKPVSIYVSNSPPSCYGECTAVLSIDSVAGGTRPYLFSLDGSVYTYNSVFKNQCAGNFHVYAQDANGCMVDTTASILQSAQPTISIGSDTLIKLGDSVFLKIVSSIPDSAIKKVVWSPVSSDSVCAKDSLCTQQTVRPFVQTFFKATLTDKNGCAYSATATVSIDKNKPMFIPTAFSPGSIGANSLFLIYGSPVIKKIKSLEVYNRWGGKIFAQYDFSTDDPTKGWDGTLNGRILEPQVFVYWIEVEYQDGKTETIQGDVTLIR